MSNQVQYPLPDRIRKELEGNDISEVLSEEKNMERAKGRILRGIKAGYTGFSFTDGYDSKAIDPHPNKEIELNSIPIARILVSILSDRRAIDRYCQAEAKTFIERIEEDEDLSLIELSEKMGLDIKKVKESNYLSETFLCGVLEENYDVNDCRDKYEEILQSRGGKDKEYYKINYDVFTRYSHLNKDLKLPGINFQDGISLMNRNIFISYLEEALKHSLQKDLPYNTSDIEDQIEEENIEELRDEITKLKDFSEDYSSDLGEENILDALDYIDPDSSYDRWRNVGFALADYYDDQERAKEVYRLWSEKGAKYDEKTPKYINKIIEEGSLENKDERVTVGTLIYYAKKNGFSFEED